MSIANAQHSNKSHAQQQEQAMLVLLAGVFAIVAFAALIPWVIAITAGWLHSGEIPSLSLPDALSVAFHGQFWTGDPAAAYPAGVARLLPGGWGFWSTGGLLLVLVAAVVVAAAREIQHRMSQVVADRRWYHVFLGRRPQAFGRFRSVKDLVVKGPAPDRVIIGKIAKPPALIAAQRHVQISVIAAPQTGKTSAIVAPSILEHAGPVVTTSTKTDIVRATLARREQLGDVRVWDPFGPATCSWDLLQGCEDWGHALLVARWLVSAMQLSQSSSGEYFDAAAQELVAPLLHAAALTDDKTMVDVYHWVRDGHTKTPTAILTSVGNDDALARLNSILVLNPRQRDGVTGSLQVQLAAYGHPAAARTAVRGPDGITPGRLFDGSANTIYIVADREHQRMLAPLVITMLCSLLYAASEHENRVGGPVTPGALFAIDETAQIAPIKELPQILAVSLSSGVRFMTVWHSVAQMRDRYGSDAASSILALSQAKVFLGSITDDLTRQELVNLLGQQQMTQNGQTQWRDTLTAQALQRPEDEKGLLVHSELAPVVFSQRRYYKDSGLLKLAQPLGREEAA